jgi:lipoprotein signal peptidase
MLSSLLLPHPAIPFAAVPFVLAIGVGFSDATNAQEGFGILTSSSVAPIISVLLINLVKKPAKKVGVGLACVLLGASYHKPASWLR